MENKKISYKTYYKIVAVLMVILTAVIFISSFLPVATIHLNEFDTYGSSGNSSVNIGEYLSELMPVGMGDDVEISTANFKSVITDFDKTIFAAKREVYAIESLILLRQLSEVSPEDTSERQKINEKITKNLAKHENLLSSVSEEERLEIEQELEDEDSDLAKLFAMPHAVLTAYVHQTFGFYDSTNMIMSGSADSSFMEIAGAFGASALVLLTAVFSVAVIVVAVMQCIYFAFAIIKNIIHLARGFKCADRNLIVKLYPKKIDWFVGFLAIEIVLSAYYGDVLSLGIAGVVLVICYIAMKAFCSITKLVTVKGGDAWAPPFYKRNERLICFASALSGIIVILIILQSLGGSVAGFGEYSANEGMVSYASYAFELTLAMLLKLIAGYLLFSMLVTRSEVLGGVIYGYKALPKLMLKLSLPLLIISLISFFSISTEFVMLAASGIYLVISVVWMIVVSIFSKKQYRGAESSSNMAVQPEGNTESVPSEAEQCTIDKAE